MHLKTRKTPLFASVSPILALVSLVFFSAPSFANQALHDLLELRGYTRIGGDLEFSVYNKEENRSRWLAIDKSEDGYRIKEYDRERNEILIQFNGREARLPLQASRISEMTPNDSTSESAGEKKKVSLRRPSQVSQRNSDKNIPPPPRTLPPERTANSSRTSSGNRNVSGGFSSGRGNRSSDDDSGQKPPKDGDSSSGESDDEDEDSWGSAGKPPPIPSSPPPGYRPD